MNYPILLPFEFLVWFFASVARLCLYFFSLVSNQFDSMLELGSKYTLIRNQYLAKNQTHPRCISKILLNLVNRQLSVLCNVKYTALPACNSAANLAFSC